MRKVK